MGARPYNRTRVLLLGPTLGAVSGVSTHLNQLLRSSLASDFDLRHFQVGSDGLNETRTQKLLRLVISPVALVVRILRDLPDIVHINASLDHKSFPRDAVYLFIARALRRKVIFQIHGGDLPQDLYTNSMLTSQFVARILRAPNMVVVLAKSELEAYSQFVPVARLKLIANAIQPASEPQTPSASAAEPLRLVYVGRLVRPKGVSDCIAAASLLHKAGREFKLTIAGTGPEQECLVSEARDLITANRVEFIGAVFGTAKDELWRTSHVSLSPTSHHEGLPYSLLESMASGTVPITTRVGAQPDVMQDGVHGLFVKPADPQALFEAILRLDDDRQLLAAMARQSMERIRDNYSVDRLASEFCAAYRELMSVPAESLK